MTVHQVHDVIIGHPVHVVNALATQQRLGLLVEVGEPFLRPDGLAEVEVVRRVPQEPAPAAAALVVDRRSLVWSAVAVVAVGAAGTFIYFFWAQLLAVAGISAVAHLFGAHLRRSK